jgi:hypothetical protein
MGAANFITGGTGATMREAFSNATQQAAHEYGHGGYTGTIAEKNGVVDLGKLPEGLTPYQFQDLLFQYEESFDEDESWRTKRDVYRYDGPHADLVKRAFKTWDDKWGNAIGFELGNGKYVFMGMASE